MSASFNKPEGDISSQEAVSLGRHSRLVLDNASHMSVLLDMFLALTLFLTVFACTAFFLVDTFLSLAFCVAFVLGLSIFLKSWLTDLVIISLSDSEIAC